MGYSDIERALAFFFPPNTISESFLRYVVLWKKLALCSTGSQE